MRLWQREEDEGWPVVRRQLRVAVVRTATTDRRREQAPQRFERLLWQRPTTVAGRHGKKAALEDKGRWWPGREGSGCCDNRGGAAIAATAVATTESRLDCDRERGRGGQGYGRGGLGSVINDWEEEATASDGWRRGSGGRRWLCAGVATAEEGVAATVVEEREMVTGGYEEGIKRDSRGGRRLV
ncbi:hypothetical protein BHM03_00041528 [Ensete ventricosum]|nr:hypothetical protein BHM03_00041528 [Ensete ventricosum]